MKRTGLLTAAAGLILAIAAVCLRGTRAPEKLPPRAEVPEQISPWAPLFDSSSPVAERLALARKLDSSFALPSVEPWIRGCQQAGAGTVSPDDLLVYNEILDQCRQRGLFPGTLGPFLAARISDAALDPVLRDYALQQLSLWLSAGGSGQPSETDAARRRAGLAALCGVVRDGSLSATTLPGTALLAMADLATRSPAELDPLWPELDPLIAGILADWNQPAGLRISAIQTAAVAGRGAHLPALRELLGALPEGSPESLAVISALGRLGDASDRSLLLALPASNPLAVRAVASAVRRLPE